MKGPPPQVIRYSILTDPHMYYFLQTPKKVNELLRSGLFQIKDNLLVEKSTKLTFKLEDYVVENIEKGYF